MELSRRQALILGASGLALAAAPGFAPRARASASDAEAAIEKFTGGAAVKDGGVKLVTPEIAENGNTVPIEVSAEGATAIMVLAEDNPAPGVATFHFGPLAGSASATTYMRLAKTQKVIAVAKMADGSFARAANDVKVTIGGCGG